MKVTCLIPAYNESMRIAETIKAVKSLPVDEIIVIDDGSTDSTSEDSKSAGADQVIVLPKNLGKGGALNSGFSEAQGDVILLLDADLEKSASEAAKLLDPIISGNADMSIAMLPRLKKKSGFGTVVKLARWGIRKLARLDVHAPLSGLRAVRREVIESAGGFEQGWGVEIGLTVAAGRAGYRVVEVPTQFSHRVTGRSLSGFIHRGEQFVHVTLFILRKWRK